MGEVSGQNEVFIDSYSLRVKFSGAFYGIEKAFSVVELSRDEISKNGKSYPFWGFSNFQLYWRFEIIPYFWHQISFWAPYLAKWLHLRSFPNVIWEF